MYNYFLVHFESFKQDKASSKTLYIISAIIILKLCLISLFLYADTKQFKLDYKKLFKERLSRANKPYE